MPTNRAVHALPECGGSLIISKLGVCNVSKVGQHSRLKGKPVRDMPNNNASASATCDLLRSNFTGHRVTTDMMWRPLTIFELNRVSTSSFTGPKISDCTYPRLLAVEVGTFLAVVPGPLLLLVCFGASPSERRGHACKTPTREIWESVCL